MRLTRYGQYLPGLLLLLGMAAQGIAGREATEQQLGDLRARIDTLQTEIDATGRQHTDALRKLEAVETQIGAVGRSLYEINAALQASGQELAGLRAGAQSLQRSLARQQAVLASQLRAAYVMGRQERLKLLLNQQDAASTGRILTYYDYFNRQRVRRLNVIHSELQQLRDTQAAIRVAERASIALRETRQREQAALKQHQKSRQQTVITLAARVLAGGAELKSMHQDELQLEKLLTGLREALDDINIALPGRQDFIDLKGKMPWPTRGKLQAKFGTTKIGELKWDGVMIAAPEGTEVRAVHRGRVAYADWLRGFGLLMIIDHGDGYMSLYGYNQSLYKETGDWVESGEPISSVGRSGGRNTAAVYFGIRSNGRAINPKQWCRKTKGTNVG